MHTHFNILISGGESPRSGSYPSFSIQGVPTYLLPAVGDVRKSFMKLIVRNFLIVPQMSPIH